MINRNHTPDSTPAAPCVVVMAKQPIPGRVKTRLSPDYSPYQAACAHAAMLECVLGRLRMHLPGRHVLALDGGGEPPKPQTDPGLAFEIPAGYDVIDQGRGDLGGRLSHVWQAVGGGRAVFFGTDSPDIPAPALSNLWQALERADAAIGPVEDGGYWCLTARRHAPKLLTGIDWGTQAVYHQTHQAARMADMTLLDLAPWHDVDTPSDLHALLDRLGQTDEPTLTLLRQRLTRITQDTTR
jgi:uncharacterized protein